jgi:hypothetical protein
LRPEGAPPREALATLDAVSNLSDKLVLPQSMKLNGGHGWRQRFCISRMICIVSSRFITVFVIKFRHGKNLDMIFIKQSQSHFLNVDA